MRNWNFVFPGEENKYEVYGNRSYRQRQEKKGESGYRADLEDRKAKRRCIGSSM